MRLAAVRLAYDYEPTFLPCLGVWQFEWRRGMMISGDRKNSAALTTSVACKKSGSAQEFDGSRILSRFFEDHEFSLGGRHPLRFE